MSSSNVRSDTVFSEGGAIFRPLEGNPIRYFKVAGIYYRAETPGAVIAALELARTSGKRIRLYYGDISTGKDWLEEHDVTGYVGNSIGPLKVPILLPNRRSAGGGAILDRCIVKMKWTSGGILYLHPTYHAGTLSTAEVGSDETYLGQRLRAGGYTHAVEVDGEARAHLKSLKAVQKYAKKMIDRKYQDRTRGKYSRGETTTVRLEIFA